MVRGNGNSSLITPLATSNVTHDTTLGIVAAIESLDEFLRIVIKRDDPDIDYPIEWSEQPFVQEDSRKHTNGSCTHPHMSFNFPLEIPVETFELLDLQVTTPQVTTPQVNIVIPDELPVLTDTGPRRSKRRRTHATSSSGT